MKIYVNKHNKGKGKQHLISLASVWWVSAVMHTTNVINKTSYTHSNAGFDILTI